jgi:sterol desaturase/sphingolipid hydroxylase (fatty acid hydroxylase superfamily)
LIPLLGVTLWQVLLYDSLLLPVIQLHHSNFRLPERWDRWLRLVIATPAMHRIHHSRVQSERDSNYSSIFSFWDRLAGTFQLQSNIGSIRFGLDGYDAEEWQRVSGLMRTPFTHPAEEQSARHSLTALPQRK